MDDLASLLELSIRALNELGLRVVTRERVNKRSTALVLLWMTYVRAHRVVVSRLGETSSNLGNLAGS